MWEQETKDARDLSALTASQIEDAMMSGRSEDVKQTIDKLGQTVSGQIDNIAVYDNQGLLTVFATGFPGGRTILRENLALAVTDSGCWECHQYAADRRPAMIVYNLQGVDVIRNVAPLVNQPRCQTCHETTQPILGKTVIDFNLIEFNRTLNTLVIGLGGAATLTVLIVVSIMPLMLRRIVTSPIDDLVRVTQAVIKGDLEQSVQFKNNDEMGKLGSALNAMIRLLRSLVNNMEEQVQEHTRDLEVRTVYLEASADIVRRTTAILDPYSLIHEAVGLIQDRFQFAFVGLYLIEPNRNWAKFRAGTGEIGKLLLDNDHKIKIGEGTIGLCIANSNARSTSAVSLHVERLDLPDLPKAGSECSLPMKSRGQVLGALYLISSLETAFNQGFINVLQMMTDQIAVVFENAQRYQDSQSALKAERRIADSYGAEAWKNLLGARSQFGIQVTSELGIQTPSRSWTPDMIAAGKTGEIIRPDTHTISIPISHYGQILGVVRLQKNESDNGWTEEEIDLMDTLVDQLEVALESARLHSDTQKSAARERLVSEITSKIRSSADPQIMLKTAIDELKRALQASRAHFYVPPSDGSNIKLDSWK
jgi:GAF domain-containing protein/HAMP domain-containing protein